MSNFLRGVKSSKRYPRDGRLKSIEVRVRSGSRCVDLSKDKIESINSTVLSCVCRVH